MDLNTTNLSVLGFYVLVILYAFLIAILVVLPINNITNMILSNFLEHPKDDLPRSEFDSEKEWVSK